MIIDGKKIAGEICEEIKTAVSSLKGRAPHLGFILVGDNAASQTYVKAKQKACASTGITSTLLTLSATTSQNELIERIADLNENDQIDGILVQLPLPSQINEQAIMLAIDPSKDVDGFHPLNVGKMLLGEEGGFLPCTPRGIQVMLERSRIPVEGKRVVIVGRSNIVGKPLAAILVQKKAHCNATVTIAHSQSEHLFDIVQSADILVAAIGKPQFIKKGMVRPGCCVIDVGINRLPDGKLVGDVDFMEVAKVASHITPVPGGVGPMTIAMLLQNTLLSYQRNFAKRTEC
jgi:methylenetetrahydrofolate dehydrogenase (NADP+)/methenyltetrahydrofolate cyclohydrolase